MATKRTKGGAFERMIATELSLWWSEGKHDDLCWRTSGSGGRATRRGERRTVNHHGDLGPTSESMMPFFQTFCVELKNGYGQWSPYDALDSIKGYGQLGKWWKKLESTTAKAKAKWPMMIWRRKGRHIVVIVPFESTFAINRLGLINEDHIRIKCDRMDLICAMFTHFCVCTRPQDVALCSKE